MVRAEHSNGQPEIPESAPATVSIIKPRSGLELLDVGELWRYRELLVFLAWRDLMVRYKQTVVGVLWVVLQPLAMMLLLTIFFGRLARLPSDGIPYPLFALSGYATWQLFDQLLTRVSASLVQDQRLIGKVYFPRLVVPVATSLATVVDFAISLLLLLVLTVAFGIQLQLTAFFVFVIVLLVWITGLGLGLWFSALNVRYRDVGHVVPFLNRAWFFLTPVVYPASIVPEAFRGVYALNPMVGVVEGMRWALFGTPAPTVSLMASGAVGSAIFLGGVLFFRSRERTFADDLG